MTQPLVRTTDVRFGYTPEVPVIDGVTLRIDPGEFVALVGPNGSGKSTLVRLLLGLLAPQSGSVELFGEPPADLHDRSRLGYVPQRPDLPTSMPITVGEIVDAGRLAGHGWWRKKRADDDEEVRHAIASVDLTEYTTRPASELSGGQLQRAFIARAFASDPELLVLDEPIAGVDAESQRRFRDSLAHLREEHGSAVLLISHELGAVADDLDRVIVLKERIVFDGPPSELTAEGVSLGVHRQDLPLWLEGLR